MSMLAVEPWRFQAHLEVWLLVAFLTAGYVYMVRVLGPKAVGSGGVVVTRGQKTAFVFGILILWLGSDWPMHDIAEEYLYSVHMFQHMALTYFMPPLVVLATPEWFVRILIGDRGLYRFVKFMAHPVRAAFVFNVAIMVSHIPAVVNASVSNGPLHYSVHVFLVTTAIIMWLPVCGPFPEFQISPMGKMIYLFMNSVVATVPAGWLTFAEGVVYKHYDIPWRVWGISVTDDQQIAGAIMKVGGAIFLWSIIGVLFVQKFVKTFRAENENTYVRQPLTTADVEKAFAETEPVREPEPR